VSLMIQLGLANCHFVSEVKFLLTLIKVVCYILIFQILLIFMILQVMTLLIGI